MLLGSFGVWKFSVYPSSIALFFSGNMKKSEIWMGLTITCWWFQPTPLKNMSQLGWWTSQLNGTSFKIHVPNHQPDQFYNPRKKTQQPIQQPYGLSTRKIDWWTPLFLLLNFRLRRGPSTNFLVKTRYEKWVLDSKNRQHQKMFPFFILNAMRYFTLKPLTLW